MPKHERHSIHEDPVSFKLKEFNPEIAQRFLPDWDLLASNSRVAFRQIFERAEGTLLRRELLIDLESGNVEVSVYDTDKSDSLSFASLSEAVEIGMHSRFGNVWVTFKSADRYLIFQPQSMDVAITT